MYLQHMRFTQDSSSAANLVRAYGSGELRINDEVYRSAIIVSASAIRAAPDIRSMEDIARLDPSRILEFAPEIVLLGTGQRQIFPAAALRAQFLGAGIGFEVMDTGAACRTFNVLVAEQRRVVALLMV
ncbi:MAG TPA: MTH938/NDUFAF3 family protein [Steroidobacteraceae bacterium]|nr:MTH938/NDUFAF3 family protein [Steroidobacteraceae bacterium]